MRPEISCYTPREGGQVMLSLQSHRTKSPYQPRSNVHSLSDWEGDESSPLREQWYPGTEESVVTSEQVLQHLPRLHQKLPDIPEDAILLFWTSISSFRVQQEKGRGEILIESPTFQEPAKQKFWRAHGGPILDGVEYSRVGELHLCEDSEWIESLYHHSSGGKYDFVVLGSTLSSYTPAYLNVMRVGWREDVAMRCDVGSILEEAWVLSRPQWRLIALG